MHGDNFLHAEQFECQVPGATAVKENVLYCVGTAPDNYLVLGDVATWVTAIGTWVLFLGALLAWHAATKTLRQMETDSENAQARHEQTMQLQSVAEADRIRNGALFELLGIYAELDAAAGTNRDNILGISHRLKVAEQRFVMVNEYSTYPIALSDYHDALLGVAYSTCDPELRKHGAMGAYRRLSGSKQRPYRDFYRGFMEPDELIAHLRGLVESMLPEDPEFYPNHLVEDYI